MCSKLGTPTPGCPFISKMQRKRVQSSCETPGCLILSSSFLVNTGGKLPTVYPKIVAGGIMTMFQNQKITRRDFKRLWNPSRRGCSLAQTGTPKRDKQPRKLSLCSKRPDEQQPVEASRKPCRPRQPARAIPPLCIDLPRSSLKPGGMRVRQRVRVCLCFCPGTAFTLAPWLKRAPTGIPCSGGSPISTRTHVGLTATPVFNPVDLPCANFRCLCCAYMA